MPRMCPMSTTQPPHSARAALVGAALVILTLAGHTAGQGALDPLGIVLVAVLSGGLSLATTHRRMTWATVLISLVLGQALLHLVLTFTSAHGHASSGMAPTLMFAGHTIAALAATFVIVNADAVIRCWLALLRATLGAAAPTLAEPTRQHSALHGQSAVDHTRAALRHGIVLRGPPAIGTAVLA